MYNRLRELGFCYGMNIAVPGFIVPVHALTEDENAKVNLLYGLFSTYRLRHPQPDFGAFLDSVFRFYRELEIGGIGFLQKILVGKKTSAQLEKLINSRVYLGDNVLTKALNNVLTNSLLFVDILVYNYYLDQRPGLRLLAANVEYIAINITYQALSQKGGKPSDERLRGLFEASLTFLDEPRGGLDPGYRHLLNAFRDTEAADYFLDIACLAVWDDTNPDHIASDFAHTLGGDLGHSAETIDRALASAALFLTTHFEFLNLFKDEGIYDNLSKTVGKLIRRNGSRLQKELEQSKELVQLLTKATRENLSDSEKERMREQLIDLSKTIPSLAIFLLPGGAVLLPIFANLVPGMLPSAFDENRVEEKAEQGGKKV